MKVLLVDDEEQLVSALAERCRHRQFRKRGILFHEDAPVPHHGDEERRFLSGQRPHVGPWDRDLDATLKDRRGDDEDHEQREGHVHQAGDVDLRVDRQITTIPAAPAATRSQRAHARPGPPGPACR